MSHATQIIDRPLVTEKCTWEGAARNRYGFVVGLRANKGQIKRAVSQLYGVRVKRVNTQVRKGRLLRTRFGYRHTKTWKKAVVQLYPGDKIELF